MDSSEETTNPTQVSSLDDNDAPRAEAVDEDEPGKPVEDDGFAAKFKELAGTNGLKPVDEAKARSTIGSTTYENASGKSIRYTKEGHSLLIDEWPTGSEELITTTSFMWNDNKWEQPDLKISYSTEELISHLLKSLSP